MRQIQASDPLGVRFEREFQVELTRDLMAGQTIFVPGSLPWPSVTTLRRHGFNLRRQGPYRNTDGEFGYTLWTEPIPGFEPGPVNERGRPKLYGGADIRKVGT